MNLTNFAEQKLLDFLFGGQAHAVPSAWHFALCTTSPGEAGDMGGELAVAGYARAEVTQGVTQFPAWAAGVKQNGMFIIWPTMNVATPPTHIAIMDAASGGNCWFYAPITNTIPTGPNVTPGLPPNSLSFTFD